MASATNTDLSNGVGKPKKAEDFPMARPDDVVMTTLMEIKADLGEFRGETRSDIRHIKDSLAKNEEATVSMAERVNELSAKVETFPAHVQVVRDLDIQLNSRIGKLEVGLGGVRTDIQTLKEKDLPQLREQLAVHTWLSSHRNKIIAAIAVFVFGAVGTVVAEVIKDAVKESIVTDARATPQAKTPDP